MNSNFPKLIVFVYNNKFIKGENMAIEVVLPGPPMARHHPTPSAHFGACMHAWTRLEMEL